MAVILNPLTGQPYEGLGLIINADYDVRTDGQPVFLGWAPPGSLDGDAAWLIAKMTYDGNGQMLTRRWAFDATAKKALFNNVWTARAGLTYA